MSTFLTANAIASFDAMVKQAYQGGGELRGTTREKTGIVGSTHRFPKMGRGMATPRIPQTDVTVMNVVHTNETVTLEDWNAAEYTDIFNQQKVNYEEKKELAIVIAGAINRRMDQLILDAMDATATSLTVSQNIGGTNSGLNVDKLRRASRLLGQGGVPSTDRHLAASYIGQEQILGETEATSSDFNVVKALVNGDINRFVSFLFHWIEDRDEGGLDLTSNVRTSFAWHKEAVGLAVGIEFRTEINYIPQKTSWLTNGLFSAGSIAIDDAGIVEIATVE